MPDGLAAFRRNAAGPDGSRHAARPASREDPSSSPEPGEMLALSGPGWVAWEERVAADKPGTAHTPDSPAAWPGVRWAPRRALGRVRPRVVRTACRHNQPARPAQAMRPASRRSGRGGSTPFSLQSRFPKCSEKPEVGRKYRTCRAFLPPACSPRTPPYETMGLLLLEAGVALALLLFIVWLSLPRRKNRNKDE